MNNDFENNQVTQEDGVMVNEMEPNPNITYPNDSSMVETNPTEEVSPEPSDDVSLKKDIPLAMLAIASRKLLWPLGIFIAIFFFFREVGDKTRNYTYLAIASVLFVVLLFITIKFNKNIYKVKANSNFFLIMRFAMIGLIVLAAVIMGFKLGILGH